MKEISKNEEQRIIEALEAAVKLANEGTSPDDALVKVAQDYEFPPEIIKRMTAAYNTSKTLSHLKHAGADERGDSFPIASPESILGQIFPKEPETPATKAASLLHPEYLAAVEDLRVLTKEASVTELPPMTEKTAAPYEHEASYAAKKVMDNHAKLSGLAKQADDAFRHVYFKFLGELDKVAGYWRQAKPCEPFDLVEKRAVATYGIPARTVMEMIYEHGKLDDQRLHVKRANADDLGTQEMHFDSESRPYSDIEGLMFLTGELNRIRKEAAEIKHVMDDHAVSNINLLPPQPVYDAITRFMKAAGQEMPEKVKEVYLSIRNGQPKAPVTKKAALDDMFAGE